jgi:hypothetical protein
MAFRFSCYCDGGLFCGPHHTEDTDWCPNPPTLRDRQSTSWFCKDCADSYGIPEADRQQTAPGGDAH